MTNRFDTNKVIVKKKFMNEDVNVRKLTVGQVLEIQHQARALAVNSEDAAKASDEKENIALLIYVVKAGVAELAEIPDDDFYNFPMDELSALSNEIMKFSGLVK